MTEIEKVDKRKRIRTHTKTWDLLKRHDLEEVQKLHYKYGIYKAAKLLKTDPSIIRYLAIREGWKRPLPIHLHVPYLEGRWTSLKTNFIPDNLKPNKNKNERIL